MEKIRIQKLISNYLACSRRKAEDIIKNKIVVCNGTRVKLGDKASLEDEISIDGVKLELNGKNEKIYLMLNKPRGYVTTLSDEKGRKTVLDLIYPKIKQRVYPVGRLDKNSQGLLFLTNDGEFCNSIIHPKNKIEKIYIVTIKKEISEEDVTKLENGVYLDGKKTRRCRVEVLYSNPQKSKFKIFLREGKKRQIRNMVKEVLNTEVITLKRIAIGNVKLNNLLVGQFRKLTKKELESLCRK